MGHPAAERIIALMERRGVFEGLDRLYIDAGLIEHDLVGFNLAELTRSLIVSRAHYLELAGPTAILPFAVSNHGA